MPTETERRIKRRWQQVGPQNNILSGGGITLGDGGNGMYPGSSVTDTSADFMGDWRAADSWMRQDMWRTRNRSRQLQRGNSMCRNLGRTMCHFVLGPKGFHMKVNAITMKSLGDREDGKPDEAANIAIKALMDKMGTAANFETRKRLSRRAFDELIVWKLIFDGEVLVRKIRGFDNEFGFAWQMIDPDYLDHNLNRVEPSGNIIKMGVELEKDYKFPVAYWFLHSRPNDYFYNYADSTQQRYYRVPADEVIHIFHQTEDSEATRGWPWLFSGMVNLFRMERFAEAAIINAEIGARRPYVYETDYPEGFEGDPNDLTPDGAMIDKLPAGRAQQLPVGVHLRTVDTRYPDAAMTPFLEAMSLGMSLTMGTSYATTTGDLSKANFVSSKLGIEAENALFHGTQEMLIEKWKAPCFDEQLYRAMLARKISLPIAKFEKFNQPVFTGHRRSGIQPLEEAKANEANLNNRLTSISEIIEAKGMDRDEVFANIARDEEDMRKLGFGRIAQAPIEMSDGDESEPPEKKVIDKPGKE